MFIVLIFIVACNACDSKCENIKFITAPINENILKDDSNLQIIPYKEVDTPSLPASEAEIKEMSALFESPQLMGDLIDTDDFYVGYDSSEFFIFFNFKDRMLRKVDINSGDVSDIMNITSDDSHYVMSILYSDSWVIWTESLDEALHIGSSTGEDWAIYAANIYTKEIIQIDHERKDFPKDRSVNAMPIDMSVCGNTYSFVGYDMDDGGVYQAVKVFNFETKELRIIAKLYDEDRGFSSPSVGEDVIVFSSSRHSKEGTLVDTILYLYDLESGELSEIENPRNAILPSTGGNYMVASIREFPTLATTIVIYDIKEKQWILEFDQTASAFKKESSGLNIDYPVIYEHYLVWNDYSYDLLFVYDFENNIFYRVLDKEVPYYPGVVRSFQDGVFVWIEHPIADGEISRLNYTFFLKKAND